MPTDFLDQKRAEIAERLKELRPLVEEYERLQGAASALHDVPAAGDPPTPRARRPRARATASSRSTAPSRGRRPGRPKGSGRRSEEAHTLVKANPGITIPEIAERLGMKQNYLYRVLPALAESGLVRKDGRRWYPRDAV